MIQDVAQQSQYWNELINSAAHSSGLPASQVAVTMLDEPDNKKLLVNFLAINGIKASTKDATIDLAKKAHDLLTNATAQIININKQAGYTITPQTAYGKLLDQFSRQTANNYTKNANQAADGTPARYSVMGFDFGDAVAVVAGGVAGVFGTPAAGAAVFSGVEGIKNASQNSGSSTPAPPPVNPLLSLANDTTSPAPAALRKFWMNGGWSQKQNAINWLMDYNKGKMSSATKWGLSSKADAPDVNSATMYVTQYFNAYQSINLPTSVAGVTTPSSPNALVTLDGLNVGGGKQVKWTSLGFGAVGILLLIALFSGGKKK